MTVIHEWVANEARTNGQSFDGFTHPITGRIHRQRMMTVTQRSHLLTELAMQYINRFGVFSTGALDGDNGALQPNVPAELHIMLESLAKLPPKMTKVEYGIWLSQQSEHVTRLVVLTEGDQQNLPVSYYDKFCYWFIKSVIPSELGDKFATRFDAGLNIAAWEAREEAKVTGASSREIFEAIMEQAFQDAKVTLDPLISHAPTTDSKLMLKTVVYSLLARKDISPDSFMNAVNVFAHIAPHDYFAGDGDWQWRNISAKITGFDQLVAEGLLIPLQNEWNEGWLGTLEEVQKFMDAMQFVEDLVVFIPRSAKIFELLLPS